MGSVRRGASARGQHVARATAAPDGARAALAHGAEGLLLGLVFARPRLPHRLLHSPRRDTARRLLPLSEEPAASRIRVGRRRAAPRGCERGCESELKFKVASSKFKVQSLPKE